MQYMPKMYFIKDMTTIFTNLQQSTDSLLMASTFSVLILPYNCKNECVWLAKY